MGYGRRSLVSIALLIAIIGAGFVAVPVGPAGAAGTVVGSPMGVVRLAPASATAGATTTLTVTYVASTLARFAGHVRTDVTSAFSAPQSSSAGAASYVHVTTTTCASASVAATPSGSGFRIELTVDCAAGKSAVVQWTNVTVPAVAATYPLAFTSASGSSFRPLPTPPVFTAKAGIATHLTIDAPATVDADSPFSFTIVARDALANVDPSFDGVVSFDDTRPSSDATLPAMYSFNASDGGSHFFRAAATMRTLGVNELAVETAGFGPSGSAPINVLEPLHVAPLETTIAAGTPQAFTASAGGGDLTSQAVFSIAPDGDCTGATCTPTNAGPHLVTAQVGNDLVSAAIYATSDCTRTWLNVGTDGAWDDPANWTDNVVPTTGDVVCLPDGTYTVTAHDAETGDVLTIGHGVTLLLQGDGTFTAPILNVTRVVDHGLLRVETNTGATRADVSGTALGIASDGAFEIAGAVPMHVTAEVYNAGTVNVGADATIRFDCPGAPCTLATWTNLRGSHTVVNGSLTLDDQVARVDHQRGADLAVESGGHLHLQGVDATFRDGGGTISGPIELTSAQLAVVSGVTGKFLVDGATGVAGTIGDAQWLLAAVRNGDGTTTARINGMNALTNRGLIFLIHSQAGDASLAADVMNTPAGGISVVSSGNGDGQASIEGSIDNFGQIGLGINAHLSVHCGLSCSGLSWINRAGSQTGVSGGGTLEVTDRTVDLRTGARLVVVSSDNAIFSAGSGATFTDNGGTILGHVSTVTGVLQLNAGTTGEFDVYAFSFVNGSVGTGQTVSVIGGAPAHGPAGQANFTTTGLVNHGRILLTSEGELGAASFTGNMTNGADGIVRAVKGAGGPRSVQRLVNYGRLIVDAGVEMAFTTSLTLGPTGVLDSSVGAGTNYGRIRVLAGLTLGGVLHVTLVSGYTPHKGEQRLVVDGTRNATRFANTTSGGYTITYSGPKRVYLTK